METAVPFLKIETLIPRLCIKYFDVSSFNLWFLNQLSPFLGSLIASTRNDLINFNLISPISYSSPSNDHANALVTSISYPSNFSNNFNQPTFYNYFLAFRWETKKFSPICSCQIMSPIATKEF